MAEASEFIGSSGTLIGAALETVGYYYQSFILDSLSIGQGQTALASIAGLLLTIGAIVALISTVTTGGYKMWKWLLLGPAMFFFALDPRIETGGVEWKNGWEERPRDAVIATADKTSGEDLGDEYVAKVPALFANYNKLISKTVQGAVGTIHAGKTNMDLKFVLRPMLNGVMMSSVVQDQGLRELIHASLLDSKGCQKEIESARKMADLAYSEQDRDYAASEFQSLINSNRKILGPNAQRFVKDIARAYPQIFSMQLVTTADDAVRNVRADCHDPRNLDQLEDCIKPEADINALLEHVRSQDQRMQNEVESVRGIGLTGKNFQDAVALRLKSQFPISPDVEKRIREPFSCMDIWKFAFIGLHVEAKKSIDMVLKEAEDRDWKKEDALPELRALLINEEEMRQRTSTQGGEVGPSNVELTNAMISAIAKRIFSNEAKKGSTAAILTNYISDGPSVNRIGVAADSPMETLERTRLQNEEWRERSKIMVAAGQMPYYQGIALYFLAILYPFFAMLLLVPGKHSGFLMWFMLWFWVKSWDFGYAVVQMLDDVLYSIFSHNLNANTGVTWNGLSVDLPAAVWAMREADPTFQLATYYSIIGVCLHSVPVVSSMLILGSLKGGAGMISAGIDRIRSSDFGAIGKGTGFSGGSTNAFVHGKLMGNRYAYHNRQHNAVAGLDLSQSTPLQNPNSPSMGIQDQHLRIGGPDGRSFAQMQQQTFQKVSQSAFHQGYAIRAPSGTRNSNNMSMWAYQVINNVRSGRNDVMSEYFANLSDQDKQAAFAYLDHMADAAKNNVATGMSRPGDLASNLGQLYATISEPTINDTVKTAIDSAMQNWMRKENYKIEEQQKVYGDLKAFFNAFK